MKNIIPLIIAALSIALVTPAIAGSPHTVCGQIFTIDGTRPGDGQVMFRAFIAGRPKDVLTENSSGCAYQNGWFQVGIGNFASEWKEGEILVIEFGLKGSEQTARVEHVLTNRDPEDLGAIPLQN